MPLSLILSSYVAASRVGGGGQIYVLPRFGIDPVLVPTVALGRHPGKGAPGGGAIADAAFDSALKAVEADGLFGLTDLWLGGYFASAAQVETAAAVIDAVRAAPRRGAATERAVVVVDPILGDDPQDARDADADGLYVRPEVETAVRERLLPRADWLTPNVWELERLTGRPARSPEAAATAASALPAPALVTSVPVGPDRVGLVLVEGGRATLFAHEILAGVPHGTGDLAAAVFGAGLVEGLTPRAAAGRAARAAIESARAAVAWGAPELPLVALGDRLVRPSAEVEIVDL